MAPQQCGAIPGRSPLRKIGMIAAALLCACLLSMNAVAPAIAGQTNVYQNQCPGGEWTTMTVFVSWAPLENEYLSYYGRDIVQIETVGSQTFNIHRLFMQEVMVQRMGMMANGQWLGYYPEEGGWHLVSGPLNSQGGIMQQWTVEAHQSISIGTHLTISGVPGAFIVDGHADVRRGELVVYAGTGFQALRWMGTISPDTNDRHAICFFVVGGAGYR